MKVTKSILNRFINGTCSPEEEALVYEWLNSGEWPSVPEEKIPDNIRQKVWSKIRKELHYKEERRKSRILLKIAAALIVLIVSGIFLYQYSRKDQPEIYITMDGAHRKIILADSSVVFMSPNSKLTLAAGYGEDNRTMALEGEASFEVAQDAKNPFTVETGDITTVALGTSFSVDAYPDSQKINVLLSYGKVVVNNNNNKDKIFLKPGEEVQYDPGKMTLTKEESHPERLTYPHRILYFKDAGVKEVVEKLARYYSIQIDTAKLGEANWKVSGEFDYQPLDVVMKAIAYSCNIHYKIKGKTLILKQNYEK